MIKAEEELLRLQKENQDLKAKVYALSSQIISVEQDKIDLTNEIKGLKEGIANAREEMETEYNHYYNMVASREFVGLKMAIDILNSYLSKESEEQDAT